MAVETVVDTSKLAGYSKTGVRVFTSLAAASGAGEGFMTGAAIGGTVGATVGSFVPVIGNAVGAILGTVLGGIFGGFADIFGESDRDRLKKFLRSLGIPADGRGDPYIKPPGNQRIYITERTGAYLHRLPYPVQFPVPRTQVDTKDGQPALIMDFAALQWTRGMLSDDLILHHNGKGPFPYAIPADDMAMFERYVANLFARQANRGFDGKRSSKPPTWKFTQVYNKLVAHKAGESWQFGYPMFCLQCGNNLYRLKSSPQISTAWVDLLDRHMIIPNLYYKIWLEDMQPVSNRPVVTTRDPFAQQILGAASRHKYAVEHGLLGGFALKPWMIILGGAALLYAFKDKL